MEDVIHEGDLYRLTCDLAVTRWCVCSAVLAKGSVVRVVERPSPNRLLVDTGRGLHKVRASTFRMCVDYVPTQAMAG